MTNQQTKLNIGINEPQAPTDSGSKLIIPLAETSYGNEEKKRGAIYTKQPVVDFMLDLVGYNQNEELWLKRLLEPSFGSGRFLFTAIDRLLASWSSGVSRDPNILIDAIRAVELDSQTYLETKDEVIIRLRSIGVDEKISQIIADKWLIHDDYLLTDFDHDFDYVIGNPPYVRQELIDPTLLKIYRNKFQTMVGRADLYIPFIEKSLAHLRSDGRLSFICADAWIKNDYGKALRQMITHKFHLEHYINMYGTDAFEITVGAYPSITVIANAPPSLSTVTAAKSAETQYLNNLSGALINMTQNNPDIHSIELIRDSARPWLLGSNDKTKIVKQIEASFPNLSDAGCSVGIGVATGADKVFIADFEKLDVEADRKLPLATNKDLPNGILSWTGKGVVNPYTDQGSLVDLNLYPKLKKHLSEHRDKLEKRHTAKSNAALKWYKTIDRITPSLMTKPKLLIPDIKGNGSAIAYDPGTLYPHHNLYYITSESWNLRALQSLLRSGIAHLFVEAYSVKIGGGYLRFQAQNLRRIRLPEWKHVAKSVQDSMIRAGEEGRTLESELLEKLYKLEPGTLSFLKEND